MGQQFLVCRGGFLVLAASILVLRLATAGLADKILPPEKLPDGSTRVTTTDDAGKTIKTVDTSKTWGDDVPTVTTTTYGPGGGKTSVSEQGESGGVKWQTKWNEYGQETYHSNEWWDKGKITAGLHFSYTYFDPKDKQPAAITKEVYNLDTQTWGPEPPKEAKPTVPLQQGLTKEDEAKAAKAMSEEQPKAAEPNLEERKDIGKLPTYDTKFYVDAHGGFSFGTTQTPSLSSNDSFTRRNRTSSFSTSFQTQASPNLAGTGGVSLGTWFNYECCRQRSWLKYFGFSLDYSYYGLDYGSQGAQFSKAFLSRDNERTLIGDGTFRSSGFVNSLAFNLKARLPLDLSGFGHWQAEVGVGPSINIVNEQFTATLDTFRNRNRMDNFEHLNIYQQFKSQTVVVPGVQVGVGVKYYPFPWLSLGPAFTYNHFRYSESLYGSEGLSGKIGVTVNNFNVTMGARYNF
jgi:hypothetical protein